MEPTTTRKRTQPKKSSGAGGDGVKAVKVAAAAKRPRSRKPPVEADAEDLDLVVDDAQSDFPPPPPGPPRAPAGGQPVRVMLLLGVVVFALLVGGLVFALIRVQDQDSTNSLRSSALKDVATFGVYMSSYNYQNLTGPTSPWAKVEDHSTAAFRSQFEKTSATLQALLDSYKGTAVGKVIAAGLTSVSNSRAVALLFIDQTVTNTVQKPNSVTQPLRVEMVLARQHGQWLIENIEVPT